MTFCTHVEQGPPAWRTWELSIPVLLTLLEFKEDIITRTRLYSKCGNFLQWCTNRAHLSECFHSNKICIICKLVNVLLHIVQHMMNENIYQN